MSDPVLVSMVHRHFTGVCGAFFSALFPWVTYAKVAHLTPVTELIYHWIMILGITCTWPDVPSIRLSYLDQDNAVLKIEQRKKTDPGSTQFFQHLLRRLLLAPCNCACMFSHIYRRLSSTKRVPEKPVTTTNLLYTKTNWGLFHLFSFNSSHYSLKELLFYIRKERWSCQKCEGCLVKQDYGNCFFCVDEPNFCRPGQGKQ